MASLDIERGNPKRNRSESPEDSFTTHESNSAWNPATLLNRVASIPPTPGAHVIDRIEELPILNWKERLRHFTWTWFTMTMSTGGIANTIHSIPGEFRFYGLYRIGLAFMFLNILLFIFNCVMISLRFYYWPKTFRASFLHPTESLFVPAVVISMGSILMNISEYGTQYDRAGPWLDSVLYICFWIYATLAVMFSAGLFLLMWSTQTFTISQMTPVWIFPAYPLLMVGPVAAKLTTVYGVAGNRAIDITVGAVCLQGIGFNISLMTYSAYLYRLMTQKLPAESTRPAMFISVGPAGFTASSLISLGVNLQRNISDDFMGNGKMTAEILRIMSNWIGIWLWGLAVFFFILSLGAHWSTLSHGRLHFAMTWNAFIFPNTALTTSTFAIGKALDDNHVFAIIGCVMVVCLIIGWLIVMSMMIRAVILKQILWPERQEDRNADHWKAELKKRQLEDAKVRSWEAMLRKYRPSESPTSIRNRL